VSAKVVQERVGHHSAAFTLDDYAHAIPAEQAEVAARLASLVGTWLLQISLQIHRA
jgi:integrase